MDRLRRFLATLSHLLACAASRTPSLVTRLVPHLDISIIPVVAASALILGLLGAILGLVLVGIARFFVDSGNWSSLGTTSAAVGSLGPGIFAVVLISAGLSWLLIANAATVVISTIVVLEGRRSKLVEYGNLLLASIPTPLLGSALLVAIDSFMEIPSSWPGIGIFITFIWVGLAIPVSLQISLSAARDAVKSLTGTIIFDRAQGFSDTRIGLGVVANVRRSIVNGATIGWGRVIIEGYVVFTSPFSQLDTGTVLLRRPSEVGALIKNMYSSTTIGDNVYLILLLFIVALLANTLQFSLGRRRE